MKLSNYLVEITGVSIYPIISLLLFVGFFVVVVIMIIKMNKDKVNYMSNIPLSDSHMSCPICQGSSEYCCNQ